RWSARNVSMVTSRTLGRDDGPPREHAMEHTVANAAAARAQGRATGLSRAAPRLMSNPGRRLPKRERLLKPASGRKRLTPTKKRTRNRSLLSFAFDFLAGPTQLGDV